MSEAMEKAEIPIPRATMTAAIHKLRRTVALLRLAGVASVEVHMALSRFWVAGSLVMILSDGASSAKSRDTAVKYLTASE